MTQTLRKYKATFILDNRGRQETLDQLVEELKREIAAVGGEVTGFESLGVRDFARPTNPKFLSAPYVVFEFSAPPSTPDRLREKLRLNPLVYRLIVEVM
jgi:small subunit ribosomal protein S6